MAGANRVALASAGARELALLVAPHLPMEENVARLSDRRRKTGIPVKGLLIGFMALCAPDLAIQPAAAAVCAAGVHRAGCAGPNGAVVTKRPVAHACYWRAGVRVCR